MSVARTKDYSDKLAARLWHLRSDGTFTDISIQCNGATFPCHRIIIAACSPVLEKMMVSDMTEAEKNILPLDSIPPQVLEHLLEYMYNGHVTVPDEILLHTVMACDFLELTELKEQCLSRSLSVLNPTNVISWFRVADELCYDKLKSSCSHILATSFGEVASGAEFMELTVPEVSSYITDAGKVEVDSDELLDATIAWVNHKRSERLSQLTNLMQNLNLNKCSVECVHDQMESHEALLNAQPMVYRVLMQGLVEIAKKETVRKVRKRREKDGKKSTLAMVTGKGHLLVMNPMLSFSNSECDRPEFLNVPQACYESPSVCASEEGFVVTGGKKSVACIMFRAATKAWSQLPSLFTPRYDHGSISIHRKVLLFGGQVGHQKSKSASVQSLELSHGGEWIEEANLPLPVCDPEVAATSNSLFLLDTASDVLYRQDLGSRRWARKAKCHHRTIGARLTVAKGQLLLVGGSFLSVFCSYDPETDEWTDHAPPTLLHAFGTVAYYDDKLFLIGGTDEGRAEEYDFCAEAWSLSSFSVPTNRTTLKAVVLDL